MTRWPLKQSSKQAVGAALIVAVVAIMLPIPARAAIPVVDFANLTQNVLTAARTLEEVDNQITQIQQGIAMLENEARNLTSLPFSVLTELQSSMGQIDQLMGQAQSLTYNVQQVQAQFQQLYPNYQSANFQGNVTQAGLGRAPAAASRLPGGAEHPPRSRRPCRRHAAQFARGRNMRWRRFSSRLGDTETPATPYQRAGQLWDQRIGSARVQAANWRLMAFGCLALAAVVTADDIRTHSRAVVTPFVVEVDRLGAVQAVAPARADVQPTDAEIAYFLAQFIERVRGLSVDPVVVRQAWLDAYTQITSHAKPMLDAYARETNPFEQIGKRAVTVDLTSVVRASPNSFRIAWIEHPFQDGTALAPEHWTAILTVVIQTPHSEAALRQNPLGIYIDAISWAREVNTTQIEGSTP